MTDYERGVEQASAVYKEVIREYAIENNKLRELVRDMWRSGYSKCCGANSAAEWREIENTIRDRMHELEVEVQA